MNDDNIADDELEDELEKALKANETNRDVFSIMRKEKKALQLREKRIKNKFKN